MAQGLINNGVNVNKSFSPNQLELLKDYTVLDSAITSYTFSGLKLNADEEIVLMFDINSVAGGAHYLFVNGNTTTSNYYYQLLEVDNTAVSCVRGNFPVFMGSGAEKAFAQVNIKLTNNGYFIYQSNEDRAYGSSGNWMQIHYGTSTFILSQITSLTITAQSASAIGIGSRFQLYKVKGQVQQTWATT